MSFPARALAILLLAISLVAGGYRWGVRATSNQFAAEQAKKDHLQYERFDAEVLRGNAASTAMQSDLESLSTNYQTLNEAFNDYRKHHPILARKPTPQSGTAVAPTNNEAAVDAADPRLTFGAVWMWNSALLGTDSPAGACGLADTSEGACVVESAVSLDDALSNQATNAKLCTEDRKRHQHLIDYIKGAPRAD